MTLVHTNRRAGLRTWLRAAPVVRAIRTVRMFWLPTLVAAAIWVSTADATSVFYPPASEIWTAFLGTWVFERVASDLLPSLFHLLGGLAIAWVVAVSAGVALGRIPTLEIAMRPMLGFLRAIPPVALIPLGLLVFDIGTDFRLFIILVGTVWPVLIATVDGVRGAPPLHDDVSRVFKITGLRRLFALTLPAASPSIAAGMRTSIGLGVILMVTSELVGTTNGIGYQQLQASSLFKYDEVWASLLLLGLLGYGLNLAFGVMERRVLRWFYQGTER